MATPVLPEADGVFEIAVALARLDLLVISAAQHELDDLALLHFKFSNGSVAIQRKLDGGRQAHGWLTLRLENHVLAVQCCGGFSAAVVVANAAQHTHPSRAMAHVNPANKARQVIDFIGNGHQVGDFDHGVLGDPAGHQHVGFWQVQLLTTGVGEDRRQLKDPGLRRV